VNNVLQRRVTIWDNLNANDYDQRRLCMGPFAGRSSNLSSRLAGMLTNPNCEFELNYIPIHTLGQWFESIKINEKRDKIDDNVDDDDDDSVQTIEVYQVDKAFHQALIQWLPEFNKIKSANDFLHSVKIDHSPQAMSPKAPALSSLNDEDSQDSITEHVPPPSSSSKIHTMECDANSNLIDLTLDDIRFLVELFYLPYEHGPNVQQMFLNFYWLRYNYNPHQNLNEWRCRAAIFHNHAKTVGRLLQKLVAIHNRALLYDVYNYINDINSTINLCSKYLHWLDDEHKRSTVFMSGDVEPWSIRGGLAGEFLNILPLGDFQALIKSDGNSSSEVYFIRPLTSNDQPAMCALCTTICYQNDIDDLLRQHSEILADKVIGGYLSNSMNTSDLCFGIDGTDDRLHGFVLTISESEKYDKFHQTKWLEQLRQKYSNVDENFFEIIECPQWIYDRYSVRIKLFLDSTLKSNQMYLLGNKLIKILTDSLLKRGYNGCHAFIDERHTSLHNLYLRLGFIDIPMIEQQNHLILVGKQF
ncbi:unnamed protein product, partial [Adineta ricciae]